MEFHAYVRLHNPQGEGIQPVLEGYHEMANMKFTQPTLTEPERQTNG